MRSIRVMKDQTDGVSASASNDADTVSHGDFPERAAAIGGRALVDGKYCRISLKQIDNVRALTLRRAFGHDEFAALEILAGFGQQDRDLQRKNMIAIEILMQAVVIALPVFEDQRCGACLAGRMACVEERIELIRISRRDAKRLVPAIRNRCKPWI